VVTPNGGNYLGSIGVTLSPPNANAAIYYTLDGSLPTTNSLLYSSPFSLKNTSTVTANAFEAGYDNSIAASALFFVQPLNFISESWLANQQFQMEFSGATGSNYVLQATTNFVNWTSISTNTPLTNSFNLLDPNAAQYPYRFYRVLQQ
jgi:hypothetical protein